MTPSGGTPDRCWPERATTETSDEAVRAHAADRSYHRYRMADAADSHNIARRTFDVVRRGYEQQEVRGYLHEISSLVERLQRETTELRERAERAEARLGMADGADEAMLLEVLGEETTRVLTSAREAAGEIRTKAEAAAERIVSDATLEASEARADAIRDAERRLAEAASEHDALVTEARDELERRRKEAQDAAAVIRAEASEQAQALRDEGQRDLDRIREEADAELEAARTQGKEMVAEAQAVRERVLRDLAARRKKARQQVEKLNAGRERLLKAYAVVQRTIAEATDELSTSLSDARLAADAASRRVEEEPDPTLEQLEEELRTAGLVDLPIVDHDDDADHDDVDDDDDHEVDHVDEDAPGPVSGEVSVVKVDAPEPEASEPKRAAPVDLGERRGRKRRKKESFDGLLGGELTKVEPQQEGEGVRILAEDQPVGEVPAVETEPQPAPEAVEPEAAEPGAEEPEVAAEDEGTGVEELVARLRAERGVADGDASDEQEADEPAVDVMEGPEDPAPGEDQPEASTPFTERDALLDPIDKELARRLKRALADEQNEVLDLLRRAKPSGVGDLLPDADEHAARWTEVVTAVLADAAAAGAAWSGGKADSVADLADELARSLTAPLRDRIDRSFAAADGNLDDVADRVRALYREWKGTRLTDTSSHYAAAAYALGVFDATPDGTQVHWVVDPLGGRCPDCDDNVLGGDVAKGSEFPTGHTCAPAHPGCRCLVLAANP